jgi:hypothetical protein
MEISRTTVKGSCVLRRAVRPRGADEASGDARARQGRRQLHAGAAVAEVQPRRLECHHEKAQAGSADNPKATQVIGRLAVEISDEGEHTE